MLRHGITTIELTDSELNAIIAAIRHLERTQALPSWIQQILDGNNKGLNRDEISQLGDSLCLASCTGSRNLPAD